MSSVAIEVARSLSARGVRYAFGIPGGPSLPYMDAFRDEGVEFVLVKNEAAGGIMATVYTQLTGEPAVCHATFGAGATNLTSGVGCAYLDRTPLLALTTEMSEANLHRNVQMNIDQQTLFKPITKWTARLSVDRVSETIDQALDVAFSEVPGPVYVGVPADIADQEAAAGGNGAASAPNITGPAPASPSSLESLHSTVAQAKRAVLAIGLSVVRLGLQDKLVRLAELLGAVVVLTPMAKGIIAESHPTYLGVLFHAASDLMTPILEQADLIIGVGYDTVEFNYEDWLPDAPLVHIDSMPADVPAGFQVTNVVGALESSIDSLLAGPAPNSQWDLHAIRDTRKTMETALRPRSSRLTPSDVLDELRDMLPDEGIMACDVGAHTHLIGQLWRSPGVRRQIMTNGWSSMGFGVPAAIGAKLAEPETPVVCVSGDGGFLMNMGDLVTARRLGLQIVFVVLADNRISLIEVKQQWRELPEYGVNLYDGSLLQSDRLLGLPVFTARTRDGVKDALRKAFAGDGPSVVEAVVDGSVYGKLIVRR